MIKLNSFRIFVGPVNICNCIIFVNTLETFKAYQYRIYKLDFCSYNFRIFLFQSFRFSGKGEVHSFFIKNKPIKNIKAEIVRKIRTI